MLCKPINIVWESFLSCSEELSRFFEKSVYTLKNSLLTLPNAAFYWSLIYKSHQTLQSFSRFITVDLVFLMTKCTSSTFVKHSLNKHWLSY